MVFSCVLGRVDLAAACCDGDQEDGEYFFHAFQASLRILPWAPWWRLIVIDSFSLERGLISRADDSFDPS